jgi:hypothetical protein
MNTPARNARRLALAALLALAVGCGTTRQTDSARAATEQLLISNAVDQSISQLDFRPLTGKKVYFDPQYLDNTVDKGYVVSSMRQHLLATGCLLQEDRAKATYIVEARAGAVGTDRHGVLVGIPQMNVPALVPGQPSQIPEIPVVKKTDQKGVAKIAVFAYNRLTGERVWQSGVLESRSTSKDLWVLGAGPFQNGSIRSGTTFAGEKIVVPFTGDGTQEPEPPTTPVTETAAWAERARPPRETNVADVFDAGPIIRLALTSYLAACLEAGPRDPGVVRASVQAPAAPPPSPYPAYHVPATQTGQTLKPAASPGAEGRGYGE